MDLRLPPDFSEFLRSLTENSVRFLLVGGYALAVHGHVRATNDLDIWIENTPDNAQRAAAALRAFGFAVTDAETLAMIEPGKVTRMGVPPMRIEILGSVSGIAFEDAFAERIYTNCDGLDIPVLGRDFLIKNKRAAARAKDLADVEALERVEGA